MKTLGTLLGQIPNLEKKEDDSFVLPDAIVGVEIEAENIRNTPMNNPRNPNVRFDIGGKWKCVEDGSLRNYGAEFVSCPMYGLDLVNALNEIEEYLTEVEEATFSHRTSVHIHLDIRDMNIYQLRKMLEYYLIFEKALFKVSGNRDISEYCIPYYGSVSAVSFLSLMCSPNGILHKSLEEDTIPSEDVLRHMEDAYVKYMALNILPIVRQGSIEFRHHIGTCDSDVIQNWINIIFCLKKAAMDDSNTIEPYEYFSHIGPITLFQDIFGDYCDLLVYEDLQKDLWEGCRVAQLAYNYNTLSSINNKIASGIDYGECIQAYAKETISERTKETIKTHKNYHIYADAVNEQILAYYGGAVPEPIPKPEETFLPEGLDATLRNYTNNTRDDRIMRWYTDFNRAVTVATDHAEPPRWDYATIARRIEEL